MGKIVTLGIWGGRICFLLDKLSSKFLKELNLRTIRISFFNKQKIELVLGSGITYKEV